MSASIAGLSAAASCGDTALPPLRYQTQHGDVAGTTDASAAALPPPQRALPFPPLQLRTPIAPLLSAFTMTLVVTAAYLPSPPCHLLHTATAALLPCQPWVITISPPPCPPSTAQRSAYGSAAWMHICVIG